MKLRTPSPPRVLLDQFQSDEGYRTFQQKDIVKWVEKPAQPLLPEVIDVRRFKGLHEQEEEDD